jgi:hypothetical protein
MMINTRAKAKIKISPPSPQQAANHKPQTTNHKPQKFKLLNVQLFSSVSIA